MNDLERVREGSIRAATFDIETTDLDAYFGECVVICIKEIGKGIETFVSWTQTDEKDMLKKAIDYLDKFDLLIGWNSSQFDFPFLNTRAIQLGLKPPKKGFRRDLCFVSRASLRMPNNKLATAERVLLKKNMKTYTTPEIKRGLIRRDKKAIEFTIDHCKKDVIATEMVYKKMIPMLSERLRRG